MILLTLRDLRFRVVRFVVVVFLGAVVFALLFVMTGLVEQFNSEPFDTVDGFGAIDVGAPGGCERAVHRIVDDARRHGGRGGCRRVGPVVTSRSSLTADGLAEEVVVVGHDIGGLGSPDTASGRPAEANGEVAVDESMDVDVGDDGERRRRSVHRGRHHADTTLLAGVPLVFMTIEDAQDLVFRSRDVISAVLVDGEATSVPEGMKLMTVDEIGQDTLDRSTERSPRSTSCGSCCGSWPP